MNIPGSQRRTNCLSTTAKSPLPENLPAPNLVSLTPAYHTNRYSLISASKVDADLSHESLIPTGVEISTCSTISKLVETSLLAKWQNTTVCVFKKVYRGYWPTIRTLCMYRRINRDCRQFMTCHGYISVNLATCNKTICWCGVGVSWGNGRSVGRIAVCLQSCTAYGLP